MYWAGCFRENLPEFYRTSGLIQLQSAGRVNNPIIDSGIGKFLPQDGFRPCAAVHISAAYKKNPHHPMLTITVHSALDKFISNDDYNIKKAYVLSNEREVFIDNGITYVPIYYIMFFQNISNVVEEFLD